MSAIDTSADNEKYQEDESLSPHRYTDVLFPKFGSKLKVFIFTPTSYHIKGFVVVSAKTLESAKRKIKPVLSDVRLIGEATDLQSLLDILEDVRNTELIERKDVWNFVDWENRYT